ncbi:hypothetical protein MKY34_20905 [Sporosarcina sp. FSL K6-1522]|uniref:hypothetical protein n=1 Tax=Sporosarcina sp. FSL K6-1522 TaxID=2921554 RepID=UPI00315B2C21
MELMRAEVLPYFEKAIYLPMLLTVLKSDLESIEKGPFKLKGPYVKMLESATKRVRSELKGTEKYLHSHNMKVIRNQMDDLFTEYIFAHDDCQDHRRYLNIRLRNHTEELLDSYLRWADK